MRLKRGWTKKTVLTQFLVGWTVEQCAVAALAPSSVIDRHDELGTWLTSLSADCARGEIEAILRAVLREQGK